jgi:hypothetical protein
VFVYDAPLIDPKWKPHLEAVPADSLNWTVRAWNCIERQDCKTLWDIAKRSEHEWMKALNFGRKSLALVKEELENFVANLEQQGIAPAQVARTRPADVSPEHLIQNWLEHCHPRDMPDNVWKAIVKDLHQADATAEPIGAIASRIGVKWPHNRYHEPLSDFLASSLQDLWSKDGLGKAKIRTVFQCAITKWSDIQKVQFSALQKNPEDSARFPTHMTLDQLEEVIPKVFNLARLSEKERRVLVDRYGLDGGRPKTLEEVGRHFEVTRERVRQVQQKAHDKVTRSKELSGLLTRWLNAIKPELLARLSADHPGFIKERSQTELMAEMGGWAGILVELVFEDIDAWLQTVAERTASGWVYGEVTSDRLNRARASIGEYFRESSVPVPLVVVARDTGLSQGIIQIAIAHGAAWSIGEFISGRKLRAKEERVLAAHAKTRTLSSPLLHRKIMPQLLYPGGDCADLSASTVNHDVGCMPTMMLPCGSVHILRIKPDWESANEDVFPVVTARPVREFGEEFVDSEEGALDEQSLYEFGMQVIRSRKLWRVNDFQAALVKESKGRFAATSAAALLISNRVHRFAPGLWGSADAKVEASDYEALLRPDDCELYVEARRAQSELCEFPMWNPEMEFRWCRWARDQKEHENLYQSLLSIAHPDDWPCPEPIRDQWKDRKKKLGRYRLAHAPHSALAQLPVVPHEILAAVGAVMGRSGISWMDLNVVHGRILNSHRCAPYLALLVALEVLRPAPHWQEFHPVGPRAAQVFRDLCGLWSRGKTDAVTDRVHALASQYVQREGDLGWVTTEQLTSLLNVLGRVAPLDADKEVPS